MWDVAAGNVIRKMIGHFGKIECVAFSGEGNVLGSAGFDAKVMLWDMRYALLPTHPSKEIEAQIGDAADATMPASGRQERSFQSRG